MKPKCPHCGHVIAQAGGLTPRQADLLKWLRSYDWSSGISPSYTEICDGTNFASKSGVHGVIHALAERGFITFIKNRNRSIKLIKWEQDNGKAAEGSTAGADVEESLPGTRKEP